MRGNTMLVKEIRRIFCLENSLTSGYKSILLKIL